MTDERLPPWEDPIVGEVRKVREALLAEAGYDVYEFCRRLSEKQATSDHPIMGRRTPVLKSPSGEAA